MVHLVEELIASVGALNLVPPGFSAYHLLMPGQVIRETRKPPQGGVIPVPTGRGE